MKLKPKHKNTNSPKPKLKCSFCDYCTNFQSTLYDHIGSHTKEQPYKCPERGCISAFTRKSSLYGHQLIHKKDDESLYKFKCSKCPYKTLINSYLQQHLKTHSDVKEFSCDLCPYRSKHKGNLTVHHKVVHLKLKPFKCSQPNCNYASSQKCDLNKHQLVHKDKNDESLYKFKCTECPFKSLRKGELTRHLVVHSEIKQFGCDLCPYRTNNKDSLKPHKKNVHSTLKPFRCSEPDCNYSGKQSSDLTKHKKVHAAEKPLSCGFPGCSFATKWDSSLKTHERVHRGERPFKCSLCSKDFGRMNSLNNHIRGHTGETPYPCPRCPFRAKSCTNLNQHLKSCKLKMNVEVAVKTGRNLPKSTAFECKVVGCGFLTEQSSSMAIHYNNIHNLPRVDLTKTKI